MGGLIEHARFFDFSEDRAAEMIKAMAATISENWEPLALRLGIDCEDIEIYRSAFEHVEKDKALNIGAPPHRWDRL